LKATIEDLDLSAARGLDRAFILELAQGEWIGHHLNILVLGPTGAGKSYLACALGEAACRQGLSVRYHRTSRLLHEIMLSHADGSFPKLLNTLARVPLLILDDWLRDTLTASQSRDLLEIVDDRYGRASTLVATQVPVEDWHARFPDPTLADAILDRLVHNAYRLELKGESMRKKKSPLAQKTG
jgi:DNA replication protein DnaC